MVKPFSSLASFLLEFCCECARGVDDASLNSIGIHDLPYEAKELYLLFAAVAER
jgi:hypothetical protein